MFDDENSSFIKVWIRSEESLIDSNEINRLNKIFSKSEQTNANGDKLNLTIIKELVESLKGKISISSEKEKEVLVTFIFIIDINIDVSFEKAGDISDCDSPKDLIKWVPSMECNNYPLAKYNEHMTTTQQNSNCCPTILIVDDTYFNIEVLQSLIEEQMHISWDSANNGLEALNLVKEKFAKTWWNRFYEFIFTDINMPIMDGYVSSTEIKKFLKKESEGESISTIPTKIYAVTAQKEAIDHNEDIFDGILLKPITIFGLQNIFKKE